MAIQEIEIGIVKGETGPDGDPGSTNFDNLKFQIAGNQIQYSLDGTTFKNYIPLSAIKQFAPVGDIGKPGKGAPKIYMTSSYDESTEIYDIIPAIVGENTITVAEFDTHGLPPTGPSYFAIPSTWTLTDILDSGTHFSIRNTFELVGTPIEIDEEDYIKYDVAHTIEEFGDTTVLIVLSK
jgi:hypothetical protein